MGICTNQNQINKISHICDILFLKFHKKKENLKTHQF